MPGRIGNALALMLAAMAGQGQARRQKMMDELQRRGLDIQEKRLNQPQYFQTNEGFYSYDPSTQKTTPIKEIPQSDFTYQTDRQGRVARVPTPGYETRTKEKWLSPERQSQPLTPQETEQFFQESAAMEPKFFAPPEEETEDIQGGLRIRKKGGKILGIEQAPPTYAEQTGRISAETAARTRATTETETAASDDALIESVEKDPASFATLSAKTRERIYPRLAARGFRIPEKPLAVGVQNKLANLDTGLSDLADLETAIANKKNQEFMGPVLGPIYSRNPYSTGAKLLLEKIDATRQNVGKAMEEGVLRKEDELKYQKILPTMNDTPEVALGKLADLKARLQKAKAIYQKHGRPSSFEEAGGQGTEKTGNVFLDELNKRNQGQGP